MKERIHAENQNQSCRCQTFQKNGDRKNCIQAAGATMTQQSRGNRLDLEPYVYPFDDDWYPMPSNMLLVADPALIPAEMLKVLLTWNGDGESMAMVTDRPIEWFPTETGTV